VYYVPDIYAIDLIQARSGELFGIPVVRFVRRLSTGTGVPIM